MHPLARFEPGASVPKEDPVPAPHEQSPRSSTAVLDAAAAALDALASLDLDAMVGDELTETVLRTQQLRGALDVAEARVLARWDSLGEWRPSGAKTASAWLAWKQRIPIAVARQRLRTRERCASCRWSSRPGPPARSTDRTSPRCWASAPLAPRRRSSATTRSCWNRPVRSASSSFKAHCDRWELLVDPDGAEQGADDDHSGPRGAPEPIVRRHVVRQDDARSDLG